MDRVFGYSKYVGGITIRYVSEELWWGYADVFLVPTCEQCSLCSVPGVEPDVVCGKNSRATGAPEEDGYHSWNRRELYFARYLRQVQKARRVSPRSESDVKLSESA